jgi:hypothetical protein
MFDDENLMMMVAWYLEHDSRVVIKGRMIEMPLSSELGYTIIRKVFKSIELNREQVDLMFDAVFEGALTDSIMRVKNEC